jgi:hypothetical protein
MAHDTITTISQTLPVLAAVAGVFSAWRFGATQSRLPYVALYHVARRDAMASVEWQTADVR